MKATAAASTPRPGPRSARAPVSQPGFLSTVSSLLRVVIVGLFLLTFLAQPFRIPSGSMIPTLQIGDFVLVSKLDFGARSHLGLLGFLERHLLPPTGVRRGDLAVFHFPPDPNQLLVKRIIALPGERLRLHDGRVLINGQPLPERYAFYTAARPQVFRDEFPTLRETDPDIDPHWWLALRHLVSAGGELTVPPDAYFVLGDNRNNSEDSRYWGFVPRPMLVGRPLLVYFAVPNGADAPDSPAARLRWLLGWSRQRAGVPH